MGGPSKKRHRAAQYSIVYDARADRLKAQVEALARQPLPNNERTPATTFGGRMGVAGSGGEEMQAPSLVQCLSVSNAHTTTVYRSYCFILLQELNQQKEACENLAQENHLLRLKLGIPIEPPSNPTTMTAPAVSELHRPTTLLPSIQRPELNDPSGSGTERSLSRGSSPTSFAGNTASTDLDGARPEPSTPAKRRALAAAPENKAFEGFVPLSDLSQRSKDLDASSSSGTLRPNLSNTSLKSLGLKTDLLGDDFFEYVFAASPHLDPEDALDDSMGAFASQHRGISAL